MKLYLIEANLLNKYTKINLTKISFFFQLEFCSKIIKSIFILNYAKYSRIIVRKIHKISDPNLNWFLEYLPKVIGVDNLVPQSK